MFPRVSLCWTHVPHIKFKDGYCSFSSFSASFLLEKDWRWQRLYRETRHRKLLISFQELEDFSQELQPSLNNMERLSRSNDKSQSLNLCQDSSWHLDSEGEPLLKQTLAPKTGDQEEKEKEPTALLETSHPLEDNLRSQTFSSYNRGRMQKRKRSYSNHPWILCGVRLFNLSLHEGTLFLCRVFKVFNKRVVHQSLWIDKINAWWYKFSLCVIGHKIMSCYYAMKWCQSHREF